jgi:hypothetical protein
LRHTNQGAQITGDTMSQARKTKRAQETRSKNTPEQKTPGKRNIRGTNIDSSIKHQKHAIQISTTKYKKH